MNITMTIARFSNNISNSRKYSSNRSTQNTVLLVVLRIAGLSRVMESQLHKNIEIR